VPVFTLHQQEWLLQVKRRKECKGAFSPAENDWAIFLNWEVNLLRLYGRKAKMYAREKL
jgi:hypothetical protein